MSPVVSIVKALRTASFPEAHVRDLRAMFVAQAVAYSVPLRLDQTPDEVCDSHTAEFMKVLNGVNDFLPVDTHLARSLFRRLVAGRYALLTAVGDIALLKAALSSETQAMELGKNHIELIQSLCAQVDFGRLQQTVAQSITLPPTDVPAEA